MKFRIRIFGALLFMVGFAQSANLPINQIPMYGGVEKTEKMKESDEAFIASFKEKGYTRESGAKEVVRLAWVEFQKKDIATAIVRFNQAWLLDPENGDAYHGFALISVQRDHAMADAERFFRIALSKKAVSVNAYVDYGRLLKMQNRFNESLEQLQKSLNLSPTAFNARSNMAFIYYKKGDFYQACEMAKGAKVNNDDLEPGFLEEICKRANNG